MCLAGFGGISIRQHTSAYVSIRQHTSAYVSIRQQPVVEHSRRVGGEVVVDEGERVMTVRHPAFVKHFSAHLEAAFEKVDGKDVVLLHLEHVSQVLQTHRLPTNSSQELLGLKH
jgi:hypothetical protein